MADKDFKVKHTVIVWDNIGVGTDSPAVAIDAGAKTTAIRLPQGNTAQRPSGTDGLVRYNSELNHIETFSTSDGWTTLTTSADGIAATTLNNQPGSYYLNLTNSTGTLPAARFSNTSHGTQVGGNLHQLASNTVHGFMASTDKLLLDQFVESGPYSRVFGELANTDISAITGNIAYGVYRQSNSALATSGRGYPVVAAGSLEVIPSTVTGGVFLRYITDTGVTYSKAPSDSWRTSYDSTNLTAAVIQSRVANTTLTITGTGNLTTGSIGSGFGNVAIGSSYFSGNGYNITSINAVNLTGIVPDANFPDTLPAANGALLTSIPATSLTGTVPAARLTGAYTGISVATSSVNGLMSAAHFTKVSAAGTMANRNVTISTAAPSGGVDGDVWFQI